MHSLRVVPGDLRAMRSIGSIVDDWFVANRSERDGDGMIHPSSASGCLRQAVYEARGVPRTDEKDIRTYRIMWMGTEIHEFVQNILETAYLDNPKIDVELEVSITVPGLPLAGSSDAVVWEDGSGIVYEFKSISPWGFKKVQREPQDHHVRQCKWYMFGLHKQGKLISHGVIVYFQRDDLGSIEHRVELTADDIEEMETTLILARDRWLVPTLTTIPERPPETKTPKGYWLCGYCPWATRCFEQDTATRLID